LPNIPAVDPNVTEVSLTIFGSLEFRVKNDGGPVSMVAPQGLQFQTSPVPEPGTFAMLGILGLCLGGYAWRKRRRVCLDRTMLLFSTVVWFLLLCSASNADIVTSVAGNGYAYGSTGYSYAPDRVVSTGDCELPRASMDVSDSIDYGGVRYARSIAEAYGNTCPANPGLRLRTHATALGGGDAYTFTNANAWGVVQWGDTIRISGVSERPSHLAINLRVVGQLGYTAYSGRQQVDFSVGVANVSGWELDGTSADAWRWANNVSFFPRPGDHIDPLITDTSTFALRRGGYWGAHDQDLLVSLPTTDDFSFTEPFPVDPTGFAGNEEVGSQYHWTQKFLIPYSEDIDAYNLNIFAFSGVAASWDATGGVDSWNTITLESVTFVDGTAVPGAITFDSGFSLPNVPEPGTLSLVGILGVCLGGYAWRKRRQCGKGPSALHDSEITATPYTTGYHI
jgi:xanthosine utilization system XapX-like protein